MLTLQPGMTVSGRVDDGQTAARPTPTSRGSRVSLATRGQQTFEMGGMPPAQVDATGHFTITGVAPGRYTINASMLPATWGPERPGRGRPGAARPDSARRLDRPVDAGVGHGRRPRHPGLPARHRPEPDVTNAVLTFTDKTQELSGTIQDASGRPTSDFTIILFPSDSRYWLPQSRRIASARPGTDGRFTIRGMPPGDYRLTAVTDVEPGEWYDPAFLGQMQRRVDSDQPRRRRQEGAGRPAGRRLDGASVCGPWRAASSAR